ncbi:MAG: C-terminal binding protein [Dethiobacteria bacterium]|jgi:D-3-phosphoglycerate dehydrogenase|nr:C-terminal binding protein [Bacillota bacterium]
MSDYKVVITDYLYETVEYEKKVITDAGGSLIPANCKSEDDIIEVAGDAFGLLVQYAQITERIMDALKNLRVISRYGVGVDSIDIKAATERGIYVANVTDYCESEVSDHALALLMSCSRKIVAANQYVKGGQWDHTLMKPIARSSSTVVGLVGFGQIPRQLAAKLKAIGFQLLVYDPFVESKDIEKYGAQKVELEQLMVESDFVSVHAPLNEKTRGLVGAEQLNQMKSSAYLINTARGPVVDEAALIEALQSKRIAGAALDVVEQEPIDPNSPLLEMDNVILTPHMAYYSEASQVELQIKTAENVAAVIKGGIPKYLVNREVLNQGQ